MYFFKNSFPPLVLTVVLQARHCLRTILVAKVVFSPGSELVCLVQKLKGRMLFKKPYLYEHVTCKSHNVLVTFSSADGWR